MTNHPVEEILGRWPNRDAIHKDASVDDPGVKIVAIHRWFQRKAIPANRWSGLIAAAKRRGIALTFEEIASAHSVRHDVRSPTSRPSAEAS